MQVQNVFNRYNKVLVALVNKTHKGVAAYVRAVTFLINNNDKD